MMPNLIALIPGVVRWGALAAVGLWLYGVGTSYFDNVRDLTAENAKLKREATLYDGRLASYKRMIDRRDAAIDASKCKPQIREWVSHPENIPKPFNPFNQLSAPRQ